MKGAWPDDGTWTDDESYKRERSDHTERRARAGNWASDADKKASVKRRRRVSASHSSVDLDKVESIRDDQAMDCAKRVCGNATDLTEAETFLDMLGIRRQVRGEPDPDRYLAHCFADLRTPRREDGSVA